MAAADGGAAWAAERDAARSAERAWQTRHLLQLLGESGEREDES